MLRSAAARLVARPTILLAGFVAIGLVGSAQARVVADAKEGADAPPTRTEVTSLRSEFGNVFRAEDGTLTAELHTRPVNFKRSDGSWVPVDPNLVATNADGYAWRNGGGPLGMKFAQVAGERIAEVEVDGRSVTFGLAGAATPSFGVVEEDKLTYPDVLPGVDLVYRSRPHQLKELIVLDEAPANPVSFRFLVSLEGLTPRQEEDGSISLLGTNGKVELFMPAGSMTDSAVDPNSTEAGFSEDVEFELSRSGSNFVLTITPDFAWLRDPERVYPVEIDPTLTKSPSLDTFVQIGITSGQAGSDELKSGTFDSGSTKARTFVKFDLTGLMDKEILSATFSLQEWHSWSCTASQVNASRVTESWNSSVVWTNQPAAASAFDTLNVAKGFSASCPAGRINFDAQAPVENWTSGVVSNHGIRVRADDESNNNGWKKFRSEEFDAGTSTDPRLEVTYNSYPTAVGSCSPATNTISTDTTPTLSCVYNDPDSGDVGHVDYQICSNVTCSAVVLSGEGTLGVDPGDPSPWTLSGTGGQLLTSGVEYWWRARSDDGRPTKGPWSSIRKYTPNQPPSVPTQVSPADEAQVPLITPVLTATDGDTDPIHDADGQALSYEFALADDPDVQASVLCTSGWLPTTNKWTALAEACGLEDGTTYYWQVRAKDAFQTSAWSSTREFQLSLPPLGAGDAPWSSGPLSVNLVSGNLVVSLPGPSYATAIGSMGTSVMHNSLGEDGQGLGGGWALDAAVGPSSIPTALVDHGLMEHDDGYDAVEIQYASGDPDFYTQVGSSSTYVPAPGESSQLLRNEDNTWTLFDSEGFIHTFGQADAETASAVLVAVELAAATPGQWELAYEFSVSDPSKITSVTDPAGRQLAFIWHSLDAVGCPDALLCVTGPDGVTWRYVGDEAGGTEGRLAIVNNGTRNLFAVTYEDAESTRIVKVQNANDLDPTNASPGYDGDHVVEIAYDGAGRVGEVSEGPITGQIPDTAVWTFAYHPGEVETPRTSRDAAGYTTVTPPRQQAELTPATNESYYDGLGREIEAVDVLGNAIATEFDEEGRILWTEDEGGNRTEFSWDSYSGLLLSETGPDPDGVGGLAPPVTSYRYDETMIGTTGTSGPLLQGLQASYYTNPDLAGRPLVRRDDASIDFATGGGWPDIGGQTTNFSVRWTGDLVIPETGQYVFSTIATDGTRLTIDDVHAIEAADRVGTAAATASEPITLEQGPHRIVLEFLAKTTAGAEVELRWACADGGGCSVAEQTVPSSALRPAWNNRTSIVSPGGDVSFSHFADPDAAQPDYELRKLDGSTNVITSYSYDAAGRTTQKVHPKGNAARTIDGSGALTGSADLDYTTEWEYYGLNEEEEPPTECDGDEVEQSGLLKSVTHSGLTPTVRVYDVAGRPVAVTGAPGIQCDVYDAEGRLVSSAAPTTYGGSSYETTSYAHDPIGAILSVSDGTLITETAYDEAGRPVLEIDSFGSEVAYVYDAENNVVSREATPPSSSSYTTAYEYDAKGQMLVLTDPADRDYEFTYEAGGRLRTVQYPNATFTWVDYDDAGQPTDIYHRHGNLTDPLPSSVPSDANPITDLAYTYDVEGRRVAETRSGGSLTSETTSYSEYDALGRLAEVTLPDGTCRHYLFDLNSNRTEIKEGEDCESTETVETYAYSETELDQLTTVTQSGEDPLSLTHKAGGEVDTKGLDELVWDGRGRQIGGTFGTTTVSYEYDPSGAVREQVADTDELQFLAGGLFQLDEGSQLVASAVDGPPGDLATYAGAPTTTSSVSYLYYDPNGNLVATADASGDRTEAFTYDPFGNLRSGSTGGDIASERFAGGWDKTLDTTSGFIAMGARPYDPTLGRFLAADPIEGGSCNLYDFACQDPINNHDPSGMVCGPGFADWVAPDRIRGLFDFRAACRNHDRCYGDRWGTWRSRCDSDFLRDMRGQCSQQHSGWWPWKVAARHACYAVARAYYTAVDRLGAPVFFRNQYNLCRRRGYGSGAYCAASAARRAG